MEEDQELPAAFDEIESLLDALRSEIGVCSMRSPSGE